jgi:Molybdate transporter of MFS superfamily
MNLFGSSIGGIPMCHGAGGMAGHVRFGARTGGASIILGATLLLLAVFVSGSIQSIFAAIPHEVLGVILFLTGAQLALGMRLQQGQGRTVRYDRDGRPLGLEYRFGIRDRADRLSFPEAGMGAALD